MQFILIKNHHKWTDQFLIFGCSFLIVFFISASFALAQDDVDDNDTTTQAIAAFETGQDHHEKGELKAAIESYKKALKLFPEFPEAELQLGNAHLALGEINEAESAFRRAVSLRDDWTLAMASLGSVLVTQKKYTEAEPLLTKAIELDDKNFPAYSALTELRLANDASGTELSTLLAKLVAITSKANPPVSMWTARGAVELKMGDASAAFKSSSKALEADPKNIAALSLAANSSLAVNDPTKAAAFAARLAASDGNSDTAKILNARILAVDGKSKEALDLLDSLKISSAEADELREKIKLGSSQDITLLEKMLGESPNDITLIAKLCHLYRLSSPEKAMAHCKKANELEPHNVEHAIGFGAALVQAKQFPQAVQILREVAKYAPDNSTVRANIGTALFQMKNYAEAKTEFLWLIERQPDLKIAYYFLAISHDHLGEYIDAMANYQEFMRRADQKNDINEIERVKLRLPTLERQIKQKRSK